MNPSQFKKLQAKWYKKLKAEGFRDIEVVEPTTRVYGSQVTIEAKQYYYQIANRFLTEHIFENKRDKIIWEYHANGMSIRNIVKTLKKVRIKTYRRAVWETVSKLRKIMKEKYLVNG